MFVLILAVRTRTGWSSHAHATGERYFCTVSYDIVFCIYGTIIGERCHRLFIAAQVSVSGLQSEMFLLQALLTVPQVRCFLFGVLQFEGLVILTNIALCY